MAARLPTEFRDELRRCREAAGLSQAQVAAKAGLTGSYVSLLESGKKPPPRSKVVTALAKALDVEPERLLERAALARTPEPIRQKIDRLVRDRTRTRRRRDSLLATTVFHLTRRPGLWGQVLAEGLGIPEDRRAILSSIARRTRDVPTAAAAAARSADLLREVTTRDKDALLEAMPSLLAGSRPARDDAVATRGAAEASEATAGEPAAPVSEAETAAPVTRRVAVVRTPPRAGVADAGPVATLDLDASAWDQGCYVLVVADDDAWPHVQAGDRLVVHPRATPRDGDLVVVLDDGVARVGTFRLRGDEVRVEDPRGERAPRRAPADGFACEGVVALLLRSLRTS